EVPGVVFPGPIHRGGGGGRGQRGLPGGLAGRNHLEVVRAGKGARPTAKMGVVMIAAPTVTGPEAVVVRVGVALPTEELSLASLQAVSTALLLAARECCAIER